MFGFHGRKRRQLFVLSVSHRIGTRSERRRAMTGSVQRKGKIYYAIIDLNGKRKWIRGGPTKKDAQRKLNERLGEVEAGTYKELPKTTFAGELWGLQWGDVDWYAKQIHVKRSLYRQQFQSPRQRLLSEIST
jgi:hypothetical protein